MGSPSFQEVEPDLVALKASLEDADAVVKCVERRDGSTQVPFWFSLARVFCGVHRPILKPRRRAQLRGLSPSEDVIGEAR